MHVAIIVPRDFFILSSLQNICCVNDVWPDIAMFLAFPAKIGATGMPDPPAMGEFLVTVYS
jgi:hypothetical protein